MTFLFATMKHPKMCHTFCPSSTENLCSKGSLSFKSFGGGSLSPRFAHSSRVYLLTARYSRIVEGSVSVNKQQYRPSDVNLVNKCRTVRNVRVLFKNERKSAISHINKNLLFNSIQFSNANIHSPDIRKQGESLSQ